MPCPLDVEVKGEEEKFFFRRDGPGLLALGTSSTAGLPTAIGLLVEDHEAVLVDGQRRPVAVLRHRSVKQALGDELRDIVLFWVQKPSNVYRDGQD